MEQNQLVDSFGQATTEFRTPSRHGNFLLRAASAPLRVLVRWAAIAFGRIASAAVGLLAPGVVAAALTVTPITWNIIGLDSNAPGAGPRHFPVGARICSPGTPSAGNVLASFSWNSANANITLRPESLSNINLGPLAAGACADAYFEIEVQPNAAAYDTIRRYHITAADGNGNVSTPAGRELYVERLVSQARNEVSEVQLNGVSALPGGTMTLMVGGIYDITLVGATATQGYNQLESFVNFPNTIFRVLAVNTNYTADSSDFLNSPNDRLYADACGWENNVASPNYRSCVGDLAAGSAGSDGKAGGGVTTTYTVQIVSGAGTTQPLNTLIYDFSGSSYHYNADYAFNTRFAQIVDPAPPTFAKSFAPSTVLAGGTSILTVSIGNANPGPLANVGFTDTLPSSPAQLLIAPSPAPVVSGCGAATLTATPGTATITVAAATVAANGSCTISVPVVAPATPSTGTYVNTTGPLAVNGISTGLTATANLGVANAPTPNLGACTSPIDLVRWTMDVAQGPGTPPAYSYIHPQLASAAATFSAAGGATNSILAQGLPTANSWGGTGWLPSGVAPPIATTTSYFQFTADTSKAYGVGISFQSNPVGPGDWANAKNNVIRVWSQADAGGFASIGAHATDKDEWTPLSGTAAATGASTTTFRINAQGRNNNKPGAVLGVDDVRITGCLVPDPPTLTKAFAPNPITVGGTSTLTFTLSNPNASPLTGAGFLDALPAGVTVASPVSATNTCGASWAPVAGATSLAFGQTTGGTIPANGSCTATVNVTASSAGAKLNISDFITATESGANTTASGVASATLNVNPIILPPVAAKSFAPATVVAGQTSILTATLQNPNSATTLTDVQLVDLYLDDLRNANPLSPAVVNGCGGVLTATAGGNGFSLVGVTLAPGASCSIEIPVTAATVGAKNNTTSQPQSVEGGPGTPASATLSVVTTAPAIALSKRVGETATGPWFDFAVVSPTGPVYYQFIVENIGNAPFASFGVSDPLLAGGSADPAGCVWQTVNMPTTLPGLPMASATLDPTAVCVRGPVLAATGAILNTATATGVYNSVNYSSVDDATYVGADPNLSLIKEISTSAAGPWTDSIASIAPGASVYYRFTIINNGVQPVAGLSITDAMVSTASCTHIDPLPPSSASVCVAGPVTTAGAPGATVTNIAMVNGTTGSGPISDTDTASYTLTPASADVSVVKTLLTAGPFVAGQAISYSLVVANAGPNTATNVQVTDTPTNLTITGVSGAGCAALPCTIASLASGVSETISVTATINAAAGAFNNAATATAAESDPVPGNNTDNTGNGGTASTSADVSIVKTLVTPGPYLVGQSINYTLRVANAGPSPAIAVQINDTPSNLTITNVSGGICTALPCLVGVLSPGNSFTINVTATINAAGAFDNSASAVAADFDPDLSNNTDNTGNGGTAGALADVSIVKTPLTASPHLAGQPITYSLVVANAGPSTATNVQVTDTPTNLTITGIAGGCAALPCTIASLASGTSVTINVTATISAAGAFDNSATATATETDPVPGNNTDDTGNGSTAAASADVDVIKTNNATSVLSGGTTTYLIVVGNAGPSAVAGVQVVDTLPAAISGASWTASGAGGATCPASGSGSINTTVDLPPGSNCAFTVVATISALATGTLSNTATATAPAGVTDPVPGNNSATDSDPITQPQADLSITKTDGVASVTQGGTTTYTIVVANAGQDGVTGAQVVDTFPAAITSATWTCIGASGGTCPASGSGNISASVNIPAGGSVTFTVIATISPVASGTLVNTATVTAPAGVIDPAPGNNSATDADLIAPAPVNADLLVTKSNSVASLVTGSATSYVIRATNQGPDTVTGALLSDPVAAGLAKTAVACSPTPGVCLTPPTIAELEGTAFALPTLASGAFYEITVTASVTAAAGATVTNVATVAAPPGVVDGNATNNSAADADPVLSVPVAVADLAVTKSNATAQVSAGQPSTYTLVITNNGPDAAPNVTLSDALPVQMTFNSLTVPAGWTCTTPAVGATGAVSCSTPSMPSGLTVTLVLAVTVAPSTPGGSTISNTANVSSGASDPVLGNNQATDNDTVVAAPVTADLSIAKSNGGTQLTAGGLTTYTLTVSNLGPDEVSGAGVTDIAPAGLTFTSWTCTVTNPGAGGSVTTACVTGSGVGIVNATINLKAGAAVTISVAATIASTASGSISNTATVVAPAGVTDPVPGNNTAMDTDSIAGVPPPVVEVPTLSEWALVLLSLMLAGLAHRGMRTRRP